eukprot:TRINITY_DN62717_c0_g1_i1.p1 TRINITY_DN62717_c0_g1~~TRINITY_DN62717_c0_g1_i1.p1  ORF type:complete len:690 (-),score=122.80 TRINITY_DN62717_c0_g1_i1:26-2095(-)
MTIRDAPQMRPVYLPSGRLRARILQHVGGFDAVVDELLRVADDLVQGPLVARQSASRAVVLRGPSGSGKSHLAWVMAAVAAGVDDEELADEDVGKQLILDISAATSGAEGSIADLERHLALATSRAREAARCPTVCSGVFADDDPESSSGHAFVVVLVAEHAEVLARRGDDEDEDATHVGGEGASAPQLQTRELTCELIMGSLRRWHVEGLPVVLLMPWAAPAPLPCCLSGLGGFDRALVLPTPLAQAQRRAVLDVCAQKLPMGEEKEHVLSREAEATGGFLPCDLSALCRSAALAAIGRSSACDDVSDLVVSAEDFAVPRFRMVPTPMRSSSAAMKASSLPATDIASNAVSSQNGLAGVIGQHEAVATLQSQIVDPFRSAVVEEKYDELQEQRQFPIGVFINGAPGSGKTHLARSLAAELRAHLFAAAPADLLAPLVGEAEKRVSSLFTSARRCAPSVVVLEDVDAVAPASMASPAIGLGGPHACDGFSSGARGDAGGSGGDGIEGTETRAALVLRGELDMLQARRAELARLRRGSGKSRASLVTEAFVLVVATAGCHSTVAPWLLSPHRLSVSVTLKSQISLADAAELLKRGLCSRCVLNDEELASVASRIVFSHGGAADVMALCRSAAVIAVRRAAARASEVGDGEKGTVSVSAQDLQAALLLWGQPGTVKEELERNGNVGVKFKS